MWILSVIALDVFESSDAATGGPIPTIQLEVEGRLRYGSLPHLPVFPSDLNDLGIGGRAVPAVYVHEGGPSTRATRPPSQECLFMRD